MGLVFIRSLPNVETQCVLGRHIESQSGFDNFPYQQCKFDASRHFEGVSCMCGSCTINWTTSLICIQQWPSSSAVYVHACDNTSHRWYVTQVILFHTTSDAGTHKTRPLQYTSFIHQQAWLPRTVIKQTNKGKQKKNVGRGRERDVIWEPNTRNKPKGFVKVALVEMFSSFCVLLFTKKKRERKKKKDDKRKDISYSTDWAIHAAGTGATTGATVSRPDLTIVSTAGTLIERWKRRWARSR